MNIDNLICALYNSTNKINIRYAKYKCYHVNVIDDDLYSQITTTRQDLLPILKNKKLIDYYLYNPIELNLINFLKVEIEINYRFISIDVNNIRYYIISESEFDEAYKTLGWILF